MNRSKVVIVDDEVPIRESLRMFAWAEHGFELAGEARHGQEALDLCDRLQPAIIVTDIVMPVMDGLKLTRLLKERKPDYQVILLTCHSEFDYAREALSLGASDYLLKGTYRDQDLLNALNRAKGRIPVIPVSREQGMETEHKKRKPATAHGLENIDAARGLGKMNGAAYDQKSIGAAQGQEEWMESVQGLEKLIANGQWRTRETHGWEEAEHAHSQDDGKRYEIRHALRFIQAHLAEPFDLPVVAGHVGLSANYFGTLFRRETGERFQDYVKRQRLEKAAHLLRNSHLKVYEVAAEVGFPNYRYFTDVFFQQYGRSPREFRSSHG